ncbi:MAG TPA: MFS transporter [Jatrophihabitans sp.]|nr:MFS transporter [Jatrophihabitans sp.]
MSRLGGSFWRRSSSVTSAGLVLLAAGAGALLGAATTPLLARLLGRQIVLTGGAVLSALPVILMAATRNGVLALILFALSAAGVMAWNVLTMSLRQTLIPPGLFGRVQGAYRTLVWGAIPLGPVAGGAIAAAVGSGGCSRRRARCYSAARSR